MFFPKLHLKAFRVVLPVKKVSISPIQQYFGLAKGYIRGVL